MFEKILPLLPEKAFTPLERVLFVSLGYELLFINGTVRVLRTNKGRDTKITFDANGDPSPLFEKVKPFIDRNNTLWVVDPEAQYSIDADTLFELVSQRVDEPIYVIDTTPVISELPMWCFSSGKRTNLSLH